jgi:exodeoxyribonuclease VII small subunit
MSKRKSADSIEEKLKRLEIITSTLEDSETTLEDSIELFEEGAKLSKECFTILEKAELKITTLKKDLDKINNLVED